MKRLFLGTLKLSGVILLTVAALFICSIGTNVRAKGQVAKAPSGTAAVAGLLNNAWQATHSLSAPRPISAKLGDVIDVLDFQGADIGEKTNNAVSALGAGCGKIRLPQGVFSFSTPIKLINTSGCILEGQGTLNGGAEPGTKLLYTGVANPIQIAGSSGTTLRDFQIVTNNPSFKGANTRTIDSKAATNKPTSLLTIENVGVFNTNGAFPNECIGIQNTYNVVLRTVGVQGCAYGIEGLKANTDFSNAVTLINVHLSSAKGSISNALLHNPGQAWNVLGSSFEMGTAAGTPKAILCDADGTHTFGVNLIGNWVGDWANNAAGSDIQVCGNGWTIQGNEIASPFNTPGWTAIAIPSNTQGIVVSGNRLEGPSGGTNATYFSLGTGVMDFRAFGNVLSKGTLMTGTPVSGEVADPRTGLTQFYQNGAAGATCSSVNAGTMKTSNGIVTHC